MKAFILVILFSGLISCESLRGLLRPKEELAVVGGCVVVIENRLKVCETPSEISIERDSKKISWPRGSFEELLSKKVDRGLKKSKIARSNEYTFRLSVFSDAFMTDRIFWLAEIEDDKSVIGFGFPESPAEWKDGEPLWIQMKGGKEQAKFTGRLLVQWSKQSNGMPAEIFSDLFPEYKIVSKQGQVWELAVPLEGWLGFNQAVAEERFVSSQILAMEVIPFSYPLGREREIIRWTWEGGDNK
jgi:hypothetical protein